MNDIINPFAINKRLRKQLTEAIIAQGGINHAGLNTYLRQHLVEDFSENGGLMTDPVIEAAADYLSSNKYLHELSDLLSEEIISALVGKEGQDHRFDYAAYTHQLKSWETLLGAEARSLLVASGTGSGKTECFMVPMLEDLARESRELGGASLTGVRAIMLYPLNALIASQQERLNRWTSPFGRRIRYALYNGQMTEGKSADINKALTEKPNHVQYRKDLRSNTPPILVTNNTMLEYMTIRKEDAPILEASAGKLRWIIVDEAHSYIGSSAAELSLLLRRVLLAFKVEAKDVRFVATSATIGDEDEVGRAALKRFWADIAGVDIEQVDIVFGERETFAFPKKDTAEAEVISSAMPNIDKNKRYNIAHEIAHSLKKAPLQYNQINTKTNGQADALLATFAGKSLDRPILPMRVHKFVRAVPGLWSCLSSDCSGDKPEGWGFGALYFERIAKCRHCEALVFEVQSCDDCGEPMLFAIEKDGVISSPSPPNLVDEFIEFGGDSVSEDNDTASIETSNIIGNYEYFIAGRAIPGARKMGIDYRTGQCSARNSDHHIWQAQYNNEPCAVCAATRTKGGSPYRSWRFGTPFLLQNAAPIVIDGVTPNPDYQKIKLPSDGRQLISFTDSRQGTARLAARVETQSERSFIRMFVYHSILQSSKKNGSNGEEIAKWKAELAQLEAVNFVGSAIEDYEEKIAAAEGTAVGRVPWQEIVEKLSQSPVLTETIAKVWDGDREISFDKQPKSLANFLLMRELARRPKRGNMIETMGLARLYFPHIEKITETGLPSSFSDKGRNLKEWKEFLYFITDQLRGAYALQMTDEEQHWLPGKAFAKKIIGPGQIKDKPSDYAWPKAKGSGQEGLAVKALAYGLGLDPTEAQDRSIINETLGNAWESLKPMLSDGGSYALDLKETEIEQIIKGWKCPISRRIVPRLIFGVSPNMIGQLANETPPMPCEVSFPTLPIIFPKTVDERKNNADFATKDHAIQALREYGIWTALHDHIAIGAPFVRAEEHSAQQPPWRLRKFEERFKAGEINMLACSTTMEMGVDIGSIEAVINTNVPPSIANYKQRVGRAGRRRQGYAFSLTIAKDTPLDRETLDDPKLYLNKKLRAPMVTMDSRPIVQRHANALLLSRWLSKDGGELNRIQAGAFFGYRTDLTQNEDNFQSPCEKFVLWLRTVMLTEEINDVIDHLTRDTILHNDSKILATAANVFEEQARRFGQIWERLNEQYQTVANEAKKSIEFQAKRICGEYLLKELANRALIPGSGFPTAVVPFVTDSKFSRSNYRSHDSGEGGAQGKRYDYPSRNADVAIREYAPGAHVVVDGLVWTSAGVALTWKRPADGETKEVQSFRWHWNCPNCGEHGANQEKQSNCPACGENPLPSIEFLEPAGFKVDWREKPHGDTDDVHYIEPEDPRISAADSIWYPLLDANAGFYRTSAAGQIFHFSQGPEKSRYDLCLDCGRAEPNKKDGPSALFEHEALTPLKGQSGRCTGNDRSFAIKREIALGYEVQTDVAELQLIGLPSKGAALAFASALREALVQSIGIETRAIGIGVQKTIGVLSQTLWSVFLYDQASGGAGYVTRLFDDIKNILVRTEEILNCRHECEKACSACILTADLFSKQEQLDRRAAHEVIQNTLTIVAKPKAVDAAFPDAKLSQPVIHDLIWRMGSIDSFYVLMPEGIDLASLAAEPFRSLWSQAERYNVPRAIIIPDALIKQSDIAFLRGLQKLSHRFEIDLLKGEPAIAPNGSRCLAYYKKEFVITSYFSRDEHAYIPSPSWGGGKEAPVISTTEFAPRDFEPLNDDIFNPKMDLRSSIVSIPHGQGQAAAQFGDLFLSNYLQPALRELGMWLPKKLERIEYSDRYLKAPLPMLCALRVMASLANALGHRDKDGENRHAPMPARLICDEASNERMPRQIFHNWGSARDQDDVARALAESLGLELEILSEAAVHARKLLLDFGESGQVVCYFDQGFGQWKSSTNPHFNFNDNPSLQANKLKKYTAFLLTSGESYVAIEKC